jgi:hypothetical protein
MVKRPGLASAGRSPLSLSADPARQKCGVTGAVNPQQVGRPVPLTIPAPTRHARMRSVTSAPTRPPGREQVGRRWGRSIALLRHLVVGQPADRDRVRSFGTC